MIDSLRNRNIELQGEQLQLAELVDDDAEEESDEIEIDSGFSELWRHCMSLCEC